MLRRRKAKLITLKDVAIIDDDRLKKAIATASLGSAMEWFDLGVYGFVTCALGKVFSPDVDPSVQMVVALGTFSAPFLVRSLDGLFFGMLGDKYGRQKIFAITIAIMLISTFCIGLISSYVTVSIWVPILLLLCKMAQGFSVGGEYTGTSIFVAEYSPDHKRGSVDSWLDSGSITGFVMGAGVVVLTPSVVGEQNSLDWGWYIPFFLALPLSIIGLYLRHALEETSAFQQHVDTIEQGDREGLQGGPRVSFRKTATRHRRSLLTCIDLVISTSMTHYILLTYVPSYLSHNLHYSEDHRVLIIIAIMVGMLFVQPVIGMLSDRLGRRPFILINSVAPFALAIPAFIMINSSVIGLIFAGLLLPTIVLNCFIRVMASSLPAMFPTHIRFNTLASALGIPVLVADLAPTLAAWLVGTTQNLIMPAYYLMVIAVVGMTTNLSMKEVANRPLKGATPAVSDIQGTKEALGEHYDNTEQKIGDIDQETTDLQAERSRLVQQHPRIND